jgi:putative tryptophan/tyrosine transport system substrate-binding protein
MRRRKILALLGVAAAAGPDIVRAASALPRVSFLAIGFGSDTTAFDAIRDELRVLGEIDGQSYQADYHMSDDAAQFSGIVREVVRSNPNIIVTVDSQTAREVFSVTHSIPTVVAFLPTDPIVVGLTESIARPSANVTGVLSLQELMIGKRIEVLTEIVPSLRRVGILYVRGNAGHEVEVAEGKKATVGRQLELVPLGLAVGDSIERVLDSGDTGHLDGLVVLASPVTMSMRQSIIAAEQARRIPAVHSFAFEVEDGALAAYGPEPAEHFQRAAEYVDRLLRGARVADLPFDMPRRILLSLNQRTARVLGLTIPPTLLAAADKIVE